jgi:hypothetical protein
MRTSFVAIISLVLIIGSTSAVMAQLNKDEVPAAFVTGYVTVDNAVEDEGHVVYEQTVDWSDPRLPPTLKVEGAWYLYGDVTTALERIDAGESEDDAWATGVVMVVEVNVLLDGDEGSWQGTGRGIEADDRYSYYVLEGDDAYEGMHVLLRGTPGHDANGPWDELYEGWIIETKLPPLPGSPTASQ